MFAASLDTIFSFEVHARRLQALKALTYASSSSEILSQLYEIVFAILDKVSLFWLYAQFLFLFSARLKSIM